MKKNETLYYARINKIEFKDFRNIENGIVEFPNASSKDFLSGASSIVGLYGQNGSGKSSVIMALGILKDVLSGNSISNKYMSSIRYGCNRSTLTFYFSMYSKIYNEEGESILNDKDSSCYDVFYTFDLIKVVEDNISSEFGVDSAKEERLVVENEILKYRVTNGKGNIILPKQVFIDTRNILKQKGCAFFGSEEKEKLYTGHNSQVLQLYKENYFVTKSKSKSFIFSKKTIGLLDEFVKVISADDEYKEKQLQARSLLDVVGNDAECMNDVTSLIENSGDSLAYFAAVFEIVTPIALVKNLCTFGTTYLHVVDTITTGLTNINTQLPLLLWMHIPNQGVLNYRISLQMDGPTHVREKSFVYVKESLQRVSDVLEKIVPGVRLNFVDLGKSLNSDNEEEHYFEISSNRGNTTIPLKYESDGIRRIVSILSLLIAAYNDESFTVAIDEIDSGIFEYLLGEILSVMSESVKGQLIFTSHNLRALEVLPSKYLCFTTTDPEKRFTKIASRGNSNLRDTYFRSIVLNTQKDPIYNPTDKYEIELALYKAGHDYGEAKN